MPADPRLDYPATHRNLGAIAQVLGDVMDDLASPAPRVLELASGSGQHAVGLAQALGVRWPDLAWQPSDPDPSCRASVDAWVHDAKLDSTVGTALDIDARWMLDDGGPDSERILSILERVGSLDLVVCINMIHIAPWTACEGLMRLARQALRPGGRLYLYGPYMLDGKHHAASNSSFSASLQARDPAWGVRDLAEVEAEAAGNGLSRERLVSMPANNHSVVFVAD